MMSTFAQIDVKSRKVHEDLSPQATGRTFLADCVNRMKVVVLNFESFRRSALELRERNGTLATMVGGELEEE